jgi:ArsR family transcriptional regulator, lead/cadmium/zinc/bismuth-responsive transcriptional repressor
MNAPITCFLSCQMSALSELAQILRLTGDPTRLRILLLCAQAPICASDIATCLLLTQSLVSHHLRLLRVGRVLRAHRQGKQMIYSVAVIIASLSFTAAAQTLVAARLELQTAAQATVAS